MVSSRYFGAEAGQRPLSPTPASSSRTEVPASPPWILDTLFRNLSYDLERVADVIDPILTAQNHCHRTDWYVQGIVIGDRAFLTTNLNPERTIQVTLCSTRWLVGHSPRCAVVVEGLADCHAGFTFEPSQGFYLADLGSPGGTWVNGRRLAPAQRHCLQDGDLIKLGSLRLEFLHQRCDQSVWEEDCCLDG